MKKLFLILLLLPFAALSQDANIAIDKRIAAKMDTLLQTFEYGTSYHLITNGPISLDIDSLHVDSGMVRKFYISVLASNSILETATGDKAITIRNTGKAYIIEFIQNLDGAGWIGKGSLAKAARVVNGAPKIPWLKISGVTGPDIHWTIVVKSNPQ